jgi:hypothetical protein
MKLNISPKISEVAAHRFKQSQVRTSRAPINLTPRQLKKSPVSIFKSFFNRFFGFPNRNLLTEKLGKRRGKVHETTSLFEI